MIYAINKQTKEHQVVVQKWPDGLQPPQWEYVQADPDGWIPWKAVSGRECPISKDQNYVVKLANGEDIDCTLNRPVIYWDDNPPSSTRVIAYKPILEESSGISRTPIMDSYRESQESKETEWDGEGLPPVGCECVYLGTKERQGEITHHTRYAAVIEYPNGGYDVGGPMCFRPIRSEEDRCIDQIMDDCGVARCVARTIYEEGYRKVE